MLRGLGWEIENPNQVWPEYSAGPGRVDHSLLANGPPIVMIEAKKLGVRLQDGIEQAINYCIREGAPYFVVTDGGRWEIYDIYKVGPLSQKLIVDFELGDPSPSRVVFEALALWRQNVVTGTVSLPHPPLVRSEQRTPIHPGLGEDIADSSPANSHPGGPSTPPVNGTTSRRRSSSSQKEPSYAGKSIVGFNLSGQHHEAKSWKELLVKLTETLFDNHQRDFNKVLSLRGRSRDYFSPSPDHMRAPAQVGISGYYVETHWSADNTVALCKKLIG